MKPTLVAAGLLLAACAAPPVADGTLPVVGDAAVQWPLPAGTVVRLLPCEVRGAAAHADAADGLWREALRQSEWLDIAAGPTAAGPATADDPRLEWTIDSAPDGGATASLLVGAERRHLASVGLAASLPATIDELALRTRLALGDPATGTRPVAAIYSADLQAVAQCERALALAQTGTFTAALKQLDAVRRRDGGAAFVLETMASLQSVVGDAEAAQDLAREALALDNRRGPTTTHRLLRTVLLTRASLEPGRAAAIDQELWTLAQVAQRERPHDPEARYTAGIALNFLGRFDEARPVLAALAQRLPEHAGVSYHLGWAALGAGDPATARAAFDRAAQALPASTTAVPRALARYEQGAHEDLREFLRQLAADPAVRVGAASHEVLRMQAAHALLTGDRDAAADLMLEDIDWLLAHPRTLELRSGELADTAETLVRLGRADRLEPLLVRALERWPQMPVGDAATYGRGLVAAVDRGDRARPYEASLGQRGCTCWSASLRAFGHRQLGELAAEQQALGAAAGQSSSPLVKAALIANLRAQGRTADADALLAALRREMRRVDLRRRSQHPLLGPELAYAWLAP